MKRFDGIGGLPPRSGEVVCQLSQSQQGYMKSWKTWSLHVRYIDSNQRTPRLLKCNVYGIIRSSNASLPLIVSVRCICAALTSTSSHVTVINDSLPIIDIPRPPFISYYIQRPPSFRTLLPLYLDPLVLGQFDIVAPDFEQNVCDLDVDLDLVMRYQEFGADEVAEITHFLKVFEVEVGGVGFDNAELIGF